MGTFNIQSSSLNSNYTYTDENIVVNGGFVKDAVNDTLQSINGSCYQKDAEGNQGEYIGNFNGYMRDGEVKYSISEMSRRDSIKVWDAIDEIEQNVLSNGEEAQA